MKKKLFLHLSAIMMVTMLSMGFAACSSDDEDIASSSELVDKLQGTWLFQRGTEKVMGMTITMDRSSLNEMKSSLEQIMGSRVEFWDDVLSFSGSKVNGVNYTLNGNKLIIGSLDAMDGISITIKSVTSSSLVLHETISMEGLDITADMEYSKQ